MAAMVAAIVAAAVMVTAVVTFAMVAANCVGVINEGSGKQRGYALVGYTGSAGKNTDLSLSKRIACTAADAAADENIYSVVFKKAGQCAVPTSDCTYNLGGNNCVVLNIVNFELFAMAKMLENFAVGIGCCNLHFNIPPKKF